MKRKNNGIQDEKSLLSEIRDRLGSDYMAYWVVWKYAPDILPTQCKTFQELSDHYKAISKQQLTERECKRFLYYEKVQEVVKYLLKRQRGVRMIELYEIYYEAAKSDPTALKEFLKLQDIFFKGSEESELESILRAQTFDDTDTETETKPDEEYKMEL